MSKEGVRVRYTDFLTLRSTFKATLSIRIKIVKKNAKCKFSFCVFDWKSELNTPLAFSFSDNFRDEY